MAEVLKIKVEKNRVHIIGPLDLSHIQEARKRLEAVARHGNIVLDLAKTTKIDTAGALMLRTLQEERNVKIENLDKNNQQIFQLINEIEACKPPADKPNHPFVRMVTHLGKAAVKVKADSSELISFFGHSCVALVKAVMNPRRLRYGSITHHIEHIGINAIPIVSLIAFLISIVLAYQGIAQLRPLGAEQFTVNLIAISVLREMGVLLTAIMVAGRSGSAFTAEIGVMKVREEVDALRAIGMNPFDVLVVPRLIAMIISLPLLAFIANIMGLLGGAVLSLSLIGLSLPEYMDRVQMAVGNGKALFVGMVKAPVFAIAIAVVGCMHGMKVSGSSESVGRETTASVVKSIFIVLMIDALFSILFEQLKI